VKPSPWYYIIQNIEKAPSTHITEIVIFSLLPSLNFPIHADWHSNTNTYETTTGTQKVAMGLIGFVSEYERV
jgi:hypothetical protein